MKNRISILLLLSLIANSCSFTAQSKIDDAAYPKVLNTALQYIFKNYKMPEEYYNQPLQILENKKYPLKERMMINGNYCLILPAGTDINKIISVMDIYQPVPLVETVKFTNKGQNAELDLVFRATGHNFLITLEKTRSESYKIIKIVERTI